MTERLERIMETGFATLADLMRETNTRIDETNHRLDETNARLAGLESRFDHVIQTVGEASRDLRRDLMDLARRVEVLEEAQGVRSR